MSLPANIVNLITNPSFEDSPVTFSTIWTNLCTNPSFSTNVTGVTAVSGTSGTSTVAQGSVTPIPAHSGTFFAKQAWTVATTAVSGGLDFASISPGTGLLYVSAWVQVSGIATQRLQWSFTGTATVTTVSNPAVVVTAGTTWVRMEAFLNVTVAGTVIPHLYAVAGTSALNWAIGSTLLVDDVMVVNGSAVTIPAFNGDGIDANGVQYSWTGTAGASTSLWQASTPTGVTATGSSTVYNDNTYVNFGLRSLAVRSSGAATPGAALSSFTVPNGTQVTVSLWVYVEPGNTAFPLSLVLTGGLAATGSTVTPTPGTWAQIFVTGTTTSGSAVNVAVKATGTPAQGNRYICDGLLAIVGTSKTYFDGSFPSDSNYRYFWSGAANQSITQAEFRGVWAEVSGLPGAPSAQVYVSGLGLTAGNVTLTRTADNETWDVAGWTNRSVVDADTVTDYAVPLARTVTYTVYFNGQQIDQMSVTIPSLSGWVQDPYDPSSAMPINTVLSDPGTLTLAKGAFDSRTRVSNPSKATVMGAKRQYSISGQRLADGAIIIIMNAWQNALSDRFKAMSETSILLFRSLPSWGSLPGLMYTDGQIQEFAVNRARVYPNDGVTQWVVTGDMVVPVSRAPITGSITNDMVQTNCAGVTNNTILARSGAKKNIEIKANPLGL